MALNAAIQATYALRGMTDIPDGQPMIAYQLAARMVRRMGGDIKQLFDNPPKGILRMCIVLLLFE